MGSTCREPCPYCTSSIHSSRRKLFIIRVIRALFKISRIKDRSSFGERAVPPLESNPKPYCRTTSSGMEDIKSTGNQDQKYRRYTRDLNRVMVRTDNALYCRQSSWYLSITASTLDELSGIIPVSKLMNMSTIKRKTCECAHKCTSFVTYG